MSARKSIVRIAALALAAWMLFASQALAVAPEKPVWEVGLTPLPTSFRPGTSEAEVFLYAGNVGSKPTESSFTLSDSLPAGIVPTAFEVESSDPKSAEPSCTITAPTRTVTCTVPAIRATGNGDIAAGSTKVTGLATVTGSFIPGTEIQGTGIPADTTIVSVSSSGTELTLSKAATLTATGVELISPSQLRPGRHLEVRVKVSVEPSTSGELPNEVSVIGGGADPASAQGVLAVESGLPPFGIRDFRALPIETDGTAATQAGSHPYALDLNFGFPTERNPGGKIPLSHGHVRDIFTDLPRGQIVNPTATPVRCTEAQLTTDPGCPTESAIGTLTVTTTPIEFPEASSFPIYNMVPPPGQAAELGADIFKVGVFIHVEGEIRSDGDYGITGVSRDTLARTANAILDVRGELWNDPSSPSHDAVRGLCVFPPPFAEEDCSMDPGHTAMLTQPGDCPKEPLSFGLRADSWEEPSPPAVLKSAHYEVPPTKECDSLKFEPTIEARPTTNQPDAPSGLNVNVHQPQNFNLGDRSTATMKDITLTLPEGLVVNPSQAEGLGACTTTQVGLTTEIGQSPIHFDKNDAQCPDASKIGTVEVTSPLLAEYTEDGTEPQLNPETEEPKLRPLHGSLFLAKPYQNPFGSLIATYLTVEDPQSGVVAKLAGKVEPDPNTGRLTATFKENPELPLEDARVRIFGGSRGALRTPPSCSSYTSQAQLVPWSGTQATPATDTFAINGGPCPAPLPHQPSFVAGTAQPTAGAFSPFSLKLSREDDTQPLAGFEATLPTGLSAKLAGVPYCTEAQIAAAKAREHPEEGVLEQASPSCPAASELGSVDVAAGAGPTPFHTSGRLYLAGPYKNAPLSVVAITPAVAGPFDLGAVVVRAALFIDPVTAQGRIVSDPLPQIIDGIPLDVRSISTQIARPSFSLNPTSCEPKQVLGSATSTLGQLASLKSPFQVGGCSSLPYKPTLSARLFGPIHRGGHPRLRTVFQAKPGEANTAKVVFALPSSEFIDQGHFRTICTRVQFAAEQCPAGSVYGHVKAITPLLDYPLEGPVYLRSSNNKLPDAVADLRGPPFQPIEFELDARVDSVNGGLRFTIATVPDAPVTKAIITTQGGKKGLFQNSTNICKGTHRANLELTAQNGKLQDTQPKLKAQCGGGKGKK